MFWPFFLLSFLTFRVLLFCRWLRLLTLWQADAVAKPTSKPQATPKPKVGGPKPPPGPPPQHILDAQRAKAEPQDRASCSRTFC